MPGRASAPTMGAREWTLLLALSVLWGGSFFFYKILVTSLPLVTIVLGRIGLAAIALNLLLLARRHPMPMSGRLWRGFFVLGLIGNVVPFTLIVYGETRITSGLASILNATTPIFTVLAAQALTVDEKLSWNKGIGVLCGFLGVAVLIGPSALGGLAHGDTIGELAGLGAAAIYAFAGLYGRRFRDVPPLEVATGQLTASTIMLIPLALVIDRPWTLPMPGAGTWAVLLALALLSTALAYLIYFRILATSGATNLLLVTFLLPVSALLLGAIFLGETVSAKAVAGMVFITLGLIAIDGRLLLHRAKPAIP